MIDKITVLKYSAAMAEEGGEKATLKSPSRRGSLSSESSESAYSSNDNPTHTIPNHHERAASVRSYRLRRRLKKRKQIQRLVDKEGDCKVVHTHVKYRGFRFIADAFTTLVDLRWRYNLSIFTMSYVLSWFFFGVVWYVIAYLHGDIGLSDRLPKNETADFEPCVYNMETFTGAFLFSIETQTTIGYGFRSVTEACPHAVLLVVVQSVISCLIDAIMIGCLFAKIARPKKRAATLKFSDKAVIAMRDGKLCLMFRVGDIRNSHLFEAHVRAYAIKPRVTSEGEFIPLYHHNMDLLYETGEDRIFLVWPLIICHIIDDKSPLYHLSAATLHDADFEIVVILEGVVEQTGLTTQARTSYLPSEIEWGYRFASSVIALYSEHDKQYNIDYSKFNSMYPVPETPKQSACEIYEALRIKEQNRRRLKEAIEGSKTENSDNNKDDLDRFKDIILRALQEIKKQEQEEVPDEKKKNVPKRPERHSMYQRRNRAPVLAKQSSLQKSRSQEYIPVTSPSKDSSPSSAEERLPGRPSSGSVGNIILPLQRKPGYTDCNGNPKSKESHV